MSKANGFSTYTAFPLFNAFITKSEWLWWGVNIRTASISSELIASSGEDAIEHSVDFATSSANSEFISYMYFYFAFGCVAINLACIFPIRPAPIKEKLIIIK